MHNIFQFIESPYLTLIFLFGFLILTVFNTSLLLMEKFKSREHIRSKTKLFFFRPILNYFFRSDELESLYLTISFSKHILLTLYALSAFFLYKGDLSLNIAALSLIIISISLLLDFLSRLFSMIWTSALLSISAPITSIYLTLFFPITLPLIKVIRFFFNHFKIEEPASDDLVQDKIKEVIHDSGTHLDTQDQKLISSFLTFKERVAREIMVPRIDMTALSSTVTIEEAAKHFLKEGYSRIPVYRETLDEIIGVLLYKDILTFLIENSESLKEPVESLVKPVIYTPENKKISGLLQEFRSKQLHLAIVVDEYGGTEGIVTIEDILEELVGEIEDEYDAPEEEQFWKLPNGCWVVDAKMSIIDIESKLDVPIPHSAEYETIGGYVFHRAGTIPSKGYSLHHDAFDLEVLSSSERSIEKIRITPRSSIQK